MQSVPTPTERTEVPIGCLGRCPERRGAAVGGARRRAAAQPRRHPQGPARARRGRGGAVRHRSHDHAGHGHDAVHAHGPGTSEPLHRTGPMRVPLTMGPPLPGERNSTSAPTVAGVTPERRCPGGGGGRGDHLTLLAFLSSGCATCAGFWKAFRQPDHLGLPAGTRLVVVTKGPEMEIPGGGGGPGPARAAGGHVHRGLGRLRGPRLPVLRAGRRSLRAGGSARGWPTTSTRWPSWSAGPRPTPGRSPSGAGAGPTPRDSTARPGSWPTTGSCWQPASCPATRASTRRRWPTCTDPSAATGEPDGAQPGEPADQATGPVEDGHAQGLRHRGTAARRVRGPHLRPTHGGRGRAVPGGPFRHLRPPRTGGGLRRRAPSTSWASNDIFAVLFEYGPESVGPTTLRPAGHAPLPDRRRLPALRPPPRSGRPVGDPVVLHRGREAVHLLRRPREPHPAGGAGPQGERPHRRPRHQSGRPRLRAGRRCPTGVGGPWN